MKTNPNLTSLPCVILAGGDSRRWSGFPKALALHWQMPLAKVMAERLSRHHQVLGVCVRQDQLTWASVLELPLMVESVSSTWLSGPMKGAWYALEFSSVPWLLVVACDMPWIPLNVGELLLRAAKTHNAQGAVLCDVSGRHTLCLLLSVDCMPVIADLLSSGEQRVGRYLDVLSLTRVCWHAHPFMMTNRNQPEERK